MTISKSGIKAQQRALDIISNNIANSDTQGFKARTVNFQSLVRNNVTADNGLLTNDFSIAAGVRSQQGAMNVGQGTLVNGSNRLDLSLTAPGFFAVENAAGELFLTRDGSFTLDHLGQLVNGNGDYVVVNGQTPFVVNDPDTLTIDANGNLQTNVNGTVNHLGQLTVYLPTANQNLEAAGNNYFRAPADGLTLVENHNSISVNQLELSNVELAQEFTNMIIAQRAYDLNIRVAQASDELKMMTNQFS